MSSILQDRILNKTDFLINRLLPKLKSKTLSVIVTETITLLSSGSNNQSNLAKHFLIPFVYSFLIVQRAEICLDFFSQPGILAIHVDT